MVAEAALTIRERIMRAFVALLEDMQPDHGDVVKWQGVFRENLEDLSDERVTGDIIGVYDPTESYLMLGSGVECTLSVQFEYWLSLGPDQVAATEVERMRGNLIQRVTAQQALIEPGTGASLTRLIEVERAERDADAPRSGYAGAFVEFKVVYRHRKGDPHRLVSQPPTQGA